MTGGTETLDRILASKKPGKWQMRILWTQPQTKAEESRAYRTKKKLKDKPHRYSPR